MPADPEPKPKKAPKIAKGYAQPSNDQITAAATAAATAAVRAVMPQPAAPIEPAELNPEDKRQVSVYEVMAKMNPDKYKDLPANAVKFIHELDQREAEFLKENPDGEFDVDGTISSSLEKKFGLAYSQHDFRDAEIESRIAPLKDELQVTRRKLEQAESILATETVQEVVRSAVTEAKTVFVEELGFKPADIEKLIEDDPYVGEVIKSEMQAVDNLVSAAHVAFAGGSHPYASHIGEICEKHEKAMMQLPASEQEDENGRQFITRAQYNSLSQKDRRAIDTGSHQQYWGMNASTAAAIGAQIVMNRAKAAVEREN